MWLKEGDALPQHDERQDDLINQVMPHARADDLRPAHQPNILCAGLLEAADESDVATSVLQIDHNVIESLDQLLDREQVCAQPFLH